MSEEDWRNQPLVPRIFERLSDTLGGSQAHQIDIKELTHAEGLDQAQVKKFCEYLTEKGWLIPVGTDRVRLAAPLIIIQQNFNKEVGAVQNAPNSIAHIDQSSGVAREIGVGPQSTINLAHLMSSSERKRKFLSPHVLPAVKRKIVKSKLLKAIQRGITPGAKRIIAVVAPAGYGKSTILGQIYDELRGSHLNWVLLLRCDDVALETKTSAYSLSTALGEALLGARTPVTEIVAALTAEHGKGVLLIDTLDLLLSKEILSPLREVFSRLTEDGATVVFTCRNFEYDDVIEPVRANFADLKDSFDRYSVPEFDEREVRKATRHFIRNDPALRSLFDADNFARDVLALSADEQRLRVIVYNPLLLALLCEFFARDGTIPPDLTVSKLYQRYWTVKISDSRKYGSTSPQAYAKNQLCLALASVLFHDSIRAGRLRPAANQADLDLDLSRVVFEARAELLSEGVLESLPLDRLGYFHQTLLEYAIAYWLNTNAGASDKADLFLKLREAEASTSQLFWWAVVRQLLAIVDAEEFTSLCSQLDTQRLAPFRAVALAAAARDESLRLLELLPDALSSGEPYQEALRLAVESLSSSHVDDEVEVLLALTGEAQEVTAVNAAQTLGNLLARRWSTLGHRLDEALKIATERSKPGSKNVPLAEDRAKICGALLKPIFPQLRREFSSIAFASLRKYFKFFGINTRSSILQLHLSPIVPSMARRKLLRLIMVDALPNWSRNESDILELLTATLDDLLASADSVLGKTYLSALHAKLPPGWETVVTLCAISPGLRY